MPFRLWGLPAKALTQTPIDLLHAVLLSEQPRQNIRAALAQPHSAMQGRFTLFAEKLRPSEPLLDRVYASAAKSASAEVPSVCRGSLHLLPKEPHVEMQALIHCRDPL